MLFKAVKNAMKEFYRSEASANVRFVEGDAERLEAFDDRSFDGLSGTVMAEGLRHDGR